MKQSEAKALKSLKEILSAWKCESEKELGHLGGPPPFRIAGAQISGGYYVVKLDRTSEPVATPYGAVIVRKIAEDTKETLQDYDSSFEDKDISVLNSTTAPRNKGAQRLAGVVVLQQDLTASFNECPDTQQPQVSVISRGYGQEPGGAFNEPATTFLLSDLSENWRESGWLPVPDPSTLLGGLPVAAKDIKQVSTNALLNAATAGLPNSGSS